MSQKQRDPSSRNIDKQANCTEEQAGLPTSLKWRPFPGGKLGINLCWDEKAVVWCPEWEVAGIVY